jgi:hypothetical protein
MPAAAIPVMATTDRVVRISTRIGDPERQAPAGLSVWTPAGWTEQHVAPTS